MGKVDVKRMELDAAKRRLGNVLKKFHGEQRASAVGEVREFLESFESPHEDDSAYDDIGTPWD